MIRMYLLLKLCQGNKPADLAQDCSDPSSKGSEHQGHGDHQQRHLLLCDTTPQLAARTSGQIHLFPNRSARVSRSQLTSGYNFSLTLQKLNRGNVFPDLQVDHQLSFMSSRCALTLSHGYHQCLALFDHPAPSCCLSRYGQAVQKAYFYHWLKRFVEWPFRHFLGTYRP